MSVEQERRATIITCLRAGRTPNEIIEFTKIPKSTVYRVAADFKAAEDEEDGSATSLRKKHDRSECRKRNADFIKQLQELVDADPSTSMRNLAAQLNVGHQTIINAIREDLRYHSYVLKVRQLLTEPMKAKRLAKCNLLLSTLKHEASGRLRFFSDEKIFTVDASFNRRNDRWLAQDPEDVPIVMTTKHPASLHVLLVVSSEGDVMPPHFFDKGQTITSQVYLEVLQTVVHPWITQVAAGRPYVFQQDGAPAHNSRIVQNWCDEHLDMFWSKEFWPPSSPDLNPLDYYCWGVIERESNKRAHNSVDSLRAAIVDVCANTDRQHLINACNRFRSRIEAVIEADGGHFE